MNNLNLAKTIQLQQIASDPSNSAWVFASAGSGKTKILTDRVLRLLLEDVSPNKILCLTFTKVAAAEMQQRINAELAKWVLCSAEELKIKLKNLTGQNPTEAELKKARILLIKILDEESKIKAQTIHSFCQTLIKIFPFEAKVKPTFEILEQSQEKLLLKKAQNEILKNAAFEPELKKLTQKINSKLHEESFSDLISNLLNKKEQLSSLKENFFGIENVIAEIFKNFAIAPNQTELEIFENFFTKIDQKASFNLAELLQKSRSKKDVQIAEAIIFFLQNPNIQNFSKYKLAFFTQEGSERKLSKESSENQEITNALKNSRYLILNFIEQLNSLRIANETALLLRLVDRILEKYCDLKKQNAVLDYNDLITETNKLLSNDDFSDWIKMKMDGSFDHILIDESQDTNHQQWNIIKALSEDFFTGLSSSNKNRSIFIVGDEKQSIYSFQGAEPNISSEIFEFFESRLGENLKKIELNNSFRSASNILKAVDEVFSDPKRKSAVSKLSEFSTHKPIRDSIGKVEIWPQIQQEKNEEKEKTYEWKIDFEQKTEPQTEEILAKIIAQKINSWVTNGRTLEGRSKPLNYGDFMILLRNRTNGFDRALNKFFHQYQVPFTSISQVNFSENLLICDLISAARFVTLPHDDLNLACLLKSPIFEVGEDDLLEICLRKNADKTTIYKALEAFPQFYVIKNDLDELIRKSEELSCFEFFYFLLQEKNHQKNFAAHFGLESLAIIDKFLLNSFDFCQNFSPNLQKFLEFMDKIDPKISLSSNELNCVRISTIHSAKGLQAPVVILGDCAYNFNQLPSSKEEISWVKFGENKFPIWCRKKEDENLILKNHRHQKSNEAEDEYLRLFYVAMTRAEDELYIGGFGNSSDPKSWYEISKNSISCAKNIAEEEFLEPIETKIIAEEKISTAKEIIQKSSNKAQLAKNPVKADYSNQSRIKGQLIHKVLEIIGKNSYAKKDWLLQIATQIIQKEEFLEELEKNKISEKFAAFLSSEEFKNLFTGKIRCEVEISGEVENQKIIGRLDLLIERENEVFVIDYKSDEFLPKSIPTQYLQQLQLYKKLIKNLYPNHQINIGIFWTNFLKLEIA